VVTPCEKLQFPSSTDALARRCEAVNAVGALGALQAPRRIEAMAMIVRLLLMAPPSFVFLTRTVR
jgi:hypothetical protein